MGARALPFAIRKFTQEITQQRGVDLESRFGKRMVLTTLYRSLLMRLMAAFIIVLVVSPYSEPFATMNGTDFGGAGAVDVGIGSKVKASTQDVLVTPLITFIIVHAFAGAVRPRVALVVPDSRRAQRAILRL